MKRLLLCAAMGLGLLTRVAAQTTTLSYDQRAINYYQTYNDATDGGTFDQGSYQVTQKARAGGGKRVAAWRKFRTNASGAATSDRALQAGDVFTVTLSATRAYGRIGFALLSSPSSVTSWADRENNYALSINLDGPQNNSGNWGAWYAKYSGGASTGSVLLYGQTNFVSYTFTIALLAPDRANITMNDGSTTSYLFDVPLNTTTPITDYSVFLEDDWNGNSNQNTYWGLGAQATQHSLSSTGSLSFGSSNGNFTVATAIADGYAANSSSIANSNALSKNGTGTMTLTAANTYTGTSTVNGGSLVLARSGGGTLPATSDVVVNSGGNLRISSNQTIRNLTVNSGANVTVDAGVTLTINGTCQLYGNPAFNGTGTVSMGAGSTVQFNNGTWPGFTNAWSWNSTATLKFAHTGYSYVVQPTDTYWSASSYPKNIVVNGGGGITLNVARSVASNITLNSELALPSSLTLLNGSTLTINSGGSVTGSGSVVYNSASSLVYNQGGAVTPGREWVDNLAGGSVTIQNGTTLAIGASATARSIGGNLTIGAGSSLTLGSLAGGDLALYGNLANSGTFTAGARTVSFLGSGSNTYSNSGTIATVLVNKSGGSLTMESNLTAGSSLTLTAGSLITSTNTLSIGGALSRGTGTIVSDGTVAFTGSSAVSVPTGTFTLLKNLVINNAAGVTLNENTEASGDVALTAGTLSPGSNVLSIGGNITRVGGNINASAAGIVFNGTMAQSAPSGAFAGPIATLTVNNSSGVTLRGNPTIGSLLLTDGTVSSTLTIGSGGSISRGNGSLAVAPTFAGTSVNITYSGSSAITTGFELPSANILTDLTLASTAPVTLDKPITVKGSLNLTSGILDLGAFNLTINAAGSSIGSAAAYVRTSGAGAYIVKNVPAGGAPFPVGNSTYNPLTIANPVTLDWSVRVEDAISNVTATYAANVAKAVQRQWDITPSENSPAPGGGATITFYYNGSSDVGASFNNATTMQVWHYYQGFWAKRGSAVAPVSANGMKAVTVGGLTYFSPYALSNSDAPLPVSLIRFTGKRTGGVNELKWTTASESNNRGFAVERSTDGINFNQVSFVTSRAAGGNSTSDLSYSYSESISTGSKWYYRLKQEDLDGHSKYSAVVLLKGDKSGIITLDGIYPNPVKGATSIRLQASAQGGSVVLQLTDMQGRVVRQQSVLTEAGTSTTVNLDLAGLAAGQYHLKAMAGNGEASEAVTVVKQ